MKYAVPTISLSSQTTAPVLWRPLAYLQKASSAPRSLPGVQRDPMSHLPGVGLARCLSGNLSAKHILPEPWAAQAQPDSERKMHRGQSTASWLQQCERH